MALIQIDRNGIKQAIDWISSLKASKSCVTSGAAMLPQNCLIRCQDSHYLIDFTSTDIPELNRAYYQGVQSFILNIFGNDYVVPDKGANISNWSRNMINPDVVEMQVSQFHTSNINDEQHYYLRYITPISKSLWNTIDRELRGYVYELSGVQTQTIYPLHLTCSDLQMHHYVDEQHNYYLLIDALSPVSLEYLEKTAFNILLSIGLLYGEMPLDEAYMIAYESKDFHTPQALSYKALVKTLKNDYRIFTSNVYSVLVPLAIKKDPVNGNNRICDILTKRKWFIDEFPLNEFCLMVQNFLDYEALSWGGFYLINACHFTMEMQPGAFSMALETLTSEALSKKIPKGTLNIIDSKNWPSVKAALEGIINVCVQNGQISQGNAVKVKAKLNSLSGPTNIDKLCAPFAIYQYPLSQAEVNIVKQRNNALHGAVKASMTIDQAFTQLQNTALGLHRLCCTFLLKMAGYSGYIINNQRTFGCEEDAKPFILI